MGNYLCVEYFAFFTTIPVGPNLVGWCSIHFFTSSQCITFARPDECFPLSSFVVNPTPAKLGLHHAQFCLVCFRFYALCIYVVHIRSYHFTFVVRSMTSMRYFAVTINTIGIWEYWHWFIKLFLYVICA